MHYLRQKGAALKMNKRLIISLLMFICIEPLAAPRDPFKDVSQFENGIADFKQVQIEARIVNIDEDFTKELGLEFGTRFGDGGNETSGGLNMDLPSINNDGNKITPGRFEFNLAKLSNNILLDTELSAIESEGHGKIISRPKLITLNRKPAYIDSGEDIPYQERTGEGNTNVNFKKAVLSLKVTPIIVSAHKILLNINVNQDKVSPITVQGVPAIDTREIKTQVVVGNNETVVLGGIYEQTQDNVVSKVPILSAIPLLGRIFTYKQAENERKELLIFITPRIVF